METYFFLMHPKHLQAGSLPIAIYFFFFFFIFWTRFLLTSLDSPWLLYCKSWWPVPTPPMPLMICRLLSDPTLLIYSLNRRIQAVQSPLAQIFDHSCCLFLSLLHFFFFFCTWYSSSVWIQLCRTTTQQSRATACLGQEARRNYWNCKRKGRVQFSL